MRRWAEDRAHVERRECDQKEIGRCRVRDPEGRLHCRALRRSKSVEGFRSRPQQVMQASEGNVRLRLDTGRCQRREPSVVRSPPSGIEERRLADTRLATHNERAASLTHAVEHGIDECNFVFATDQRHVRYLSLSETSHVTDATSYPRL